MSRLFESRSAPGFLKEVFSPGFSLVGVIAAVFSDDGTIPEVSEE